MDTKQGLPAQVLSRLGIEWAANRKEDYLVMTIARTCALGGNLILVCIPDHSHSSTYPSIPFLITECSFICYNFRKEVSAWVYDTQKSSKFLALKAIWVFTEE